ncbi:MAG: hydroxyisourate hydrolase [Myxococcota bacterium]
MATLSTHVLDTALGRPVPNLVVILSRREPDGAWFELGRGKTDADGRIPKSASPELSPGTYRFVFETEEYLDRAHGGGFWPEVPLVFKVYDPNGHYHVPLLLSPHGMSSYRGS